MVKQDSIVEVNVTIKDLINNQLYETTIKKKAEDAGLRTEGIEFKPKKIILGEKEVVKGIEEELAKMNEKEKKKIVLNPDKGFGERKTELIRVVALQEFRKKDLMPVPGMIVDVNGIYGKVQSASGGRVRLDFNHPLAGKKIEVELELLKEIKNDMEKLEALAEKFFVFMDKNRIKIKEGEKEIEVVVDAKKEEEQAVEIVKKKFIEIAEKMLKGKKVKVSKGTAKPEIKKGETQKDGQNIEKT